MYRPQKKGSPFIGLLLFLLSIVLLVITGPLGLVYGLFHSLFTKGFIGVGEYFLKIAISIDQLGNVLMQHLLNDLWTKKGRYPFGNRDETISSALGRNKLLGTLTGFGKGVDSLLDTIDPNHALNSIDYYIEPTTAIIDKLAWIHIVDGRILGIRSKDKDYYSIPSGKREPGETNAQALFKRIKEDLTVELELASLQFKGIFEAPMDRHQPGTLVRMTCYSATYSGNLMPASNITEMTWLNYKDSDKIPAVDKLIFNFLKENGLLI